MRYFIFTIMLLFPISVLAQDGRGGKNDKPEIVGQKQLSTSEDESITVELSDLYVIDWNDFYPFGFSLQLYPGNNYTLSGATIIPASNYNGTLTVKVTVNDGKDDSKKFDLKVEVRSVNEAPSITGQRALSVDENNSITIQLSDLSVSDVDNTYPNGFTLMVSPGSNYVVSGSKVTPVEDFVGTLSVPVRVNDGSANSDPFSLKITVNAVSRVPQIIGQTVLTINEDESLTITLAHLKVTDGDDLYPNGFSLSVTSGSNYTLPENNVIKPSSNFNGNLTVPVTVSDGTNVSDPYNLLITVMSVNDAPVITNIESKALNYETGKGAVSVTEEFLAADADDDSLATAEIKFETNAYQKDIDALVFTNTTNITGVFDVDKGILSLIGKAPIAEYIAAMRRIEYNHEGDADSTITDKELFFTLNDGKNSSTVQQRLIRLGNSFAALDVPTGFTPNDDLVNDTWSVRPSKYTDERANPTIRVYNKRGVLVYECTGFDNEWDGRFRGEFLPADTYFYTIDLNLINAKSTYNGLVTILR
jgi:gliding motility-associated-like protein